MRDREINIQKLKYLAWEMGVKNAAEKAGVSRSTMDKIINGRYEGHTLRDETMDKIAEAFGVTVDEAFPFKSDKGRAS